MKVQKMESRSEIIKRAVIKSYEQGRFILYRRYGYNVVTDADGSYYYAINEKEAEVIRRMFALYLEGKYTADIATVLNEQDAHKPFNKGCWTKEKIKDILGNCCYCGDYYTELCGRQYFVKEHHDPIVSKAMWNAVNCTMLGSPTTMLSGYIPMSVFKQGPLKGFLKIDYTWLGRGAQDYVEACECTMKGENYIFDIGKLQFPIWDSEWRSKYRSKYIGRYGKNNRPSLNSLRLVPMLSFGSCALYFSKACELPHNFEFFIHPLDKIIAVRKCEYGFKAKKNSFYSFSFGRRLVSELMGWQFGDYHCIQGQRLGGMLFFDLTGRMRIPQSMVDGFSAEELHKYEPVCIEKDFWSPSSGTSSVEVGRHMAPEQFLKYGSPEWARKMMGSLYAPKQAIRKAVYKDA